MLSGCSSITDEAMINLSNNCTKLEVVDLSDISNIVGIVIIQVLGLNIKYRLNISQQLYSYHFLKIPISDS